MSSFIFVGPFVLSPPQKKESQLLQQSPNLSRCFLKSTMILTLRGEYNNTRENFHEFKWLSLDCNPLHDDPPHLFR